MNRLAHTAILLVSTFASVQLCDAMGLPVWVGILFSVLALPQILQALLAQNLVGKKAGPLEALEFIQGERCEVGDGYVTIVEFWATWCPPCRKSIPHLSEIYHKYCQDKRARLVSITTESIDTVKPFVEANSTMDYPIAIDGNRSISQFYPVTGIPAAFVIAANGDILWQGHPMSGLDAAIEQALVAVDTKSQ